MIAENGGYNNPALGQIAANIAQMFGPPPASDLAAYSTARVNNEKADRAKRLEQMALDESNFNQMKFDRANIAFGNYAPTSSYQAQDQNNATTQRGQDVTAATSRANNFDDNRTDLISELYGSRDPYHDQPALPATIADSFGMPAVPAMPGQPKPLSQTEVLGGQTQRLIDGGQIGDEDLKSLIMKGTDGSAKEDQIERLKQNFIATGDITDPVAAYNAAVGLVDGRLQQSRDPITNELLVIDMATGQPADYAASGVDSAPSQVNASLTGDPVIDAAMAPGPRTPDDFGEPYPATEKSFGIEGFVTGGVNRLTDGLGMGAYSPEVQQTQADFGVLKESLLNDIQSAYGRQPPSWLLQRIDGLTPDTGNPFEGVGQAKAELTSLGRSLTNELELAEQSLQTRLSPTAQVETEAKVMGLQNSLARIGQVMASFPSGEEGPSADESDVPQGVDPADWKYLTEEEKAMFR